MGSRSSLAVRLWLAIVLAVVAVLLGGPTPLAHAATFTVTKTADTDDGMCDTDCSLREAVVAANATAGDDTIHLAAGTYMLTMTSEAGLHIARESGTTSIMGAGYETTVIDATDLGNGPGGVFGRSRVFYVGYHAGLDLVGVTVTGGYTVSGNVLSGAGILNFNGYLTVTDSLIEGNVAGEDGGGIANLYGTATISNTIIRDNNTDPPEYTTTGYGGGIYNSGTMTITDSTIELNASDWGGGLASEYWLEAYYPLLTIENSTITSNTATHGAGVANIEMMPFGTEEAVLIITNSRIVDNHADRSSFFNEGGGILNLGFGATTIVSDSTISGNLVTGFNAVHPKDGSGGGIHNRAGQVDVTGTTISDNDAICDQLPGDNNECGRGGGVLNIDVGRVTITNSSISGNSATLLNRTVGDWNGGGVGGGVSHARHCDPVCKNPTTTIINTTITGNDADTGGGIDNTYEDVKLTVANSIVSGNSGDLPGHEDCWGEYTSNGHNLVGLGTGCPSDGTGDLSTVDALLGPLADNGGRTLTHALQTGSPAIDTGDNTYCPGTDQRGVARPQGAACDMGAFESECPSGMPPWPTPVGDSDCDGFTDTKEAFIGTDPLDACGAACWPPDFDDDQDVDIFDVVTFKSPIVNDTYDARHDLFGQDSVIDIFDVVAMKPFYAKSCTP